MSSLLQNSPHLTAQDLAYDNYGRCYLQYISRSFRGIKFTHTGFIPRSDEKCVKPQLKPIWR